jgi:hypothetical protein
MHGHIDARARVFPECVLLRASGPPHVRMASTVLRRAGGPRMRPLGKNPSECPRCGHASERMG